MGKFKKIDTSIEGVCIIEPTVFGDNRGYFMETYSKADFEEIGLTLPNSALVDTFGTRKTVKCINNILQRNGYNDVFSYYYGVLDTRVTDKSRYKAILYKERVQKTTHYSIYCQKQNIIEQYFSMTNSKRTSCYKYNNGNVVPVFEDDYLDKDYKQATTNINIAVCRKYALFYELLKIDNHDICCHTAQAVFNLFFHVPRKEYLISLINFYESDNGNKTKLLYKTSILKLLLKRSKAGWFFGNLIYNSGCLHSLFTILLGAYWKCRSSRKIQPY